MISGADSFVEIAQYGESKQEWLRGPLGLELASGVPSHDTFGRVFSRLDPKAFSQCFMAWTQGLQAATQGQVIALDGKTLRRSFDVASGKKALHLVSAWASEQGLVLGQQAVDAKSNEIKAIPALLALLDVKGCIVTVDALNTQKSLAGSIMERGGDYVFALKGNHQWLSEDVKTYFEWAWLQEKKTPSPAAREAPVSPFASHAQASSYDHGRHEIRRCWVMSAGAKEWPQAVEQWQGLKSLVAVEYEREVKFVVPERGFAGAKAPEKPASVERRYYLSSLSASAEKFLEIVRGHWGIENNLHWTLDVAFNEDACRVYKDHAPVNLATLRHLALNLLTQEKTRKGGVKTRRRRAGWDNDYLLLVLLGPTS